MIEAGQMIYPALGAVAGFFLVRLVRLVDKVADKVGDQGAEITGHSVKLSIIEKEVFK